MRLINLEIKDSCPVGAFIGCIFGLIVEYLRQQEILLRPKGKNSLEKHLESLDKEYNNYLS